MKHKVIGLIGGLSPESTLKYYEYCFRGINKKLGGYNTGKIIIYSINEQEAVDAYLQDDWCKFILLMKNAQKKLKKAGADFVAICCNTLHKTVVRKKRIFKIPVISILDPLVREIQKHHFKKVGLMGTKMSLLDGFYQDVLKRAGAEIIVPVSKDIQILDNIIFNYLVKGKKLRRSQEANLIRIAEGLIAQGAEAVILGCTELPQAFSTLRIKVPVLDSMQLHCQAIVDYSIGIMHEKLQLY